MISAKGIFRATHKFYVFSTVNALQKGIDINQSTVTKVQSCMEKILKREEGNGVKLYTSQNNHRVFSLESVPNLVFKMKASKNVKTVGQDDSMKARYNMMIDSKRICRVHQLGLLVIPNAKLFTVQYEGEDYEIIAEQKVDIDPYESQQQKHFEDHADSLNEAIRQLTVFIAKTGFSDVEWRNVPVINNSLDKSGNRKIALIDIEETKGAELGFLGMYGLTEEAWLAV